MADYYVDNNKTIYATQRAFTPALSGGNGFRTYLGLQDLTDLSGQSTIFVNWVRFEWSGHASQGGVGESYGSTFAGILPYDIASDALSHQQRKELDTFQDVKGWPIKNSKRFYYSYTGSNENSNNASKTIFTYNPKNALVLNREQALFFIVYNEYGQDISGLLSITAQLKRCD